eukprot:TRINITY_DN7144_c0_g1_i1.p1 TRINITY_DN7144_c0_g1~~TRINITY_DN7144_c0_g1_i1.p1  ORF type:complete len:177 (+),score=46.47 TRINITY_DN7144_c0_g1_i1:644-1174(+)
MNEPWVKEWTSESPLDKIRPVQLVVSMSHMDCMKDMLKRGYRTAVIVEDDTDFDTFFARDHGFIERLKPLEHDWNWDLLMLMRAPLYWKSDEKYAKGILKTQPAWGSNAYVLTRRGAMKFLNDLQKWHQNIDVRMAEIIRDNPDFIALAMDPPVASTFKYEYSDTVRGRRRLLEEQ